MKGSRILLGRIGAPHGVRGEVRIKAFTGDPLAIGGYGPVETEDGRAFEILSVRPAKEVIVARLGGIGDRDAAEALNGLDLFVARESLPAPEEEEYYQADLIGLVATAPSGETLGRVVAVHDFGAGDLIEIAAEGARSGELVPFTREVVPEIDLAGGRLVVVLPEGIDIKHTTKE